VNLTGSEAQVDTGDRDKLLIRPPNAAGLQWEGIT
jgi:hypothetical protein